MAERVGFEPTIPVKVYTLSKRAPSATRPSLRHKVGTRSLYRLMQMLAQDGFSNLYILNACSTNREEHFLGCDYRAQRCSEPYSNNSDLCVHWQQSLKQKRLRPETKKRPCGRERLERTKFSLKRTLFLKCCAVVLSATLLSPTNYR